MHPGFSQAFLHRCDLFNDKDFFHLLTKDPGDFDGQIQRGQILPCLQGYNGLAGNLHLACQLFLRHLPRLKTQPADGIGDAGFAVKHAVLPCDTGSGCCQTRKDTKPASYTSPFAVPGMRGLALQHDRSSIVKSQRARS